MGVGAGLYMCDVVKKFTFAISSPDEFLLAIKSRRCLNVKHVASRWAASPKSSRKPFSSSLKSIQASRKTPEIATRVATPVTISERVAAQIPDVRVSVS